MQYKISTAIAQVEKFWFDKEQNWNFQKVEGCDYIKTTSHAFCKVVLTYLFIYFCYTILADRMPF